MRTILSCSIKTAIVFSLIVVIMTEALSIFNWLCFPVIATLWSLTAILCLAVLWKRRTLACDLFKNLGNSGSLSKTEIAMLVGIIVILSVTLISSFLYPPNNWDSMTYHLSRVSNWIERQSVHCYPTPNGRQNFMPPMAEFIVLHVMILTKSDMFASSAQWFAFILSIVGIALIAGELGADRKTGILTMFIGATIPMAVLQSSSVQNDLAVSFYIIAFVYFLSLFEKEGEFSNAFWAGASLGLALLTKGTAYIVAVPFILLFFFRNIARGPSLMKSFLIIASLVIALNAGHYARNCAIYGNPLGVKAQQYVNEVHTAPAVASNIARNIALHLSSPIAPCNRLLNDAMQALHKFIGFDMNDRRTTYGSTRFAVSENFIPHEDAAQNFSTLMSIFFSIVFFIIYPHSYIGIRRELWKYLLTCVSAALLFSFLLKWQPWHSRLHTPLFLLLAPFAAIVLYQCKTIAPWIAIGLFLFAMSFGLTNLSRPLVILPDSIIEKTSYADALKARYDLARSDRLHKRFMNRPELAAPYVDSMHYLETKGFSIIGLLLRGDDWDYPFLYERQRPALHGARFCYVNVNNPSSKAKARECEPQCIISTYCPGKKISVLGKTYSHVFTCGTICMYEPENEESVSLDARHIKCMISAMLAGDGAAVA